MILLKLKKFESEGIYNISKRSYKVNVIKTRFVKAKITGSTHLVSFRVFAHKRVGQELCRRPPITGLLLEAGFDEAAKFR